MKENKQDYEQFDVDNKKEEDTNKKKPKKRIIKRIRDLLLFVGVLAAIYLIYQKTNQVRKLQKSIEDEKRKREEE